MVGTHYAPPPIGDVREATRAAIEEPLDYPALREAIVPGDRVVIPLQAGVPQAAAIIAAVWDVLASRQVRAEDVTIIRPARLDGRRDPDPRADLPESVAAAFSLRTHDATDESELAYLATSSGGERIYLAKALCDADYVLPVGVIEFDRSLGYQGTSGGMFPALSNIDAIRKHGAASHVELTPDSPRQARTIADEVGWLLGTQFYVQAIRGAAGGVSQVIAGLAEPVLTAGRAAVDEGWRLTLLERPDTVFASVDSDDASWPDVIDAAEAASRLVSRGGRVVLLSDLRSTRDSLSDALAILRESASTVEARAVLTQLNSPEQPETMRLLSVLDRAEVFLLSQLDDALAEALFLQPVDDENEARRLLAAAGSVAILEGAQHVRTEVAG